MKTLILLLLTSTTYCQTIQKDEAFVKLIIRVVPKLSNADSAFNVILPKHPDTNASYKRYDVMILDKKGNIIATKVNGKKWVAAKGHSLSEALDAYSLMLLSHYKKD